MAIAEVSANCDKINANANASVNANLSDEEIESLAKAGKAIEELIAASATWSGWVFSPSSS
ncbi:MAG: hypothetical protein PVSMB11_03120 [Desulfuromonadaceae bacterium]